MWGSIRSIQYTGKQPQMNLSLCEGDKCYRKHDHPITARMITFCKQTMALGRIKANVSFNMSYWVMMGINMPVVISFKLVGLIKIATAGHL